jgi:hypothetical protein
MDSYAEEEDDDDDNKPNSKNKADSGLEENENE